MTIIPDAAHIAHVLDGKQLAPDEFKARCPAHDDRNPSLSITGKNGTVLVKCWSGCPQSDVIDALRGMGLWSSKARPQRATPPKRSTADYARTLYRAASDDDSTVAAHPYALRKHITHAFGARRGTASGKLLGRQADCIIVPLRTWDGELVGAECINAEGKKQTFGSKAMLVLGMPEDDLATVHICEGWATAYALSRMFPRPFAAVVAFGCGRLMQTAQEAHQRYAGDVVIHDEGSGNRDAWDAWSAGAGAEYVARCGGLAP